MRVMSDLLFQTEDGTAVLAAAERARAATLVDDLALGLLGPHRPAVARRLHELLHPDHILRTMPVDEPRWAEEYRAAFGGHLDTGLIRHQGRTIETFPLALNTAVLVGNDVLGLLAWVHAECEAGGYLEAAHRPWLADLIDRGLGTGLLRASASWPAVATLLRGTGGGPVVLSVAGYGGPAEEGEAPWRAVGPSAPTAAPVPRQWEPVVEALRADPAVVPMDPATLGRPYGHGLTVLDLIAPDWSARLARAHAPAAHR
jgi:hypothetical protein